MTVTNADGTSATSAADKFAYGPAVTAVSPAAGPLAAGTVVTITGDDLGGATAVNFGSTPVTIFTTDTANQIVLAAPAATSAATVDVTVTNPDGTSATSAADKFTFEAMPMVTAISPTTGGGNGGTTVTITGTDLASATAVDFGTTAATIIGDTAAQIIVTSPAGTGSVDVTVTTAGGKSPTSAADKFQYIPVVTSVIAASGLTTGGTTVTINGGDLAGATVVDFGNTAVTKFISNSANEIVLTTPAETAGSVDVTVTDADGTSAKSPADTYTYVAPLTPTTQLSTIEGMVTANGVPVAGVTVTLTGFNLAGEAVLMATQTDSNGNYVFSQLQAGVYCMTRGSNDVYMGGNGSPGNLGGNAGVDDIYNLILASGQVATNYNFNIAFVTLSAFNLRRLPVPEPGQYLHQLDPARRRGAPMRTACPIPDSDQSFGSGSTATNTITGIVQDHASTTGVQGVQVTLTGIDYTGLAITPMVTTTDSAGNYEFIGVNPGTYTVQETVPAGEQAFSATAGEQGGFTQFNTEIYDINAAVSTTAATLSGYDFQVAPLPAVSVSAAPVINAGLVDTTTNTTSNPAVQGSVSIGTTGVPIVALFVGVNGSNVSASGTPTFDATYLLANSIFYLTEANLAQIDGQTNGFLPDGTYLVTLEAVDAAGNVTNFTVPQFTLQTTAPTVPTLDSAYLGHRRRQRRYGGDHHRHQLE